MDGERVTIRIVDREDETVVHLPEDYFGQVELSFRAGVLVNTRQTVVRTKAEVKGQKPKGKSQSGGGGV